MHTCSRCPALPVCYCLPALHLLVHTPIRYKTQLPAPRSCRTAPRRRDAGKACTARTLCIPPSPHTAWACTPCHRVCRQECPAPKTCSYASPRIRARLRHDQLRAAQPEHSRRASGPQCHFREHKALRSTPLLSTYPTSKPCSGMRLLACAALHAQLTKTRPRRQTRCARDRSAPKQRAKTRFLAAQPQGRMGPPALAAQRHRLLQPCHRLLHIVLQLIHRVAWQHLYYVLPARSRMQPHPRCKQVTAATSLENGGLCIG